ncbi:ribosome-associated protein [Nitrosomonas sp. Nm51]|uniref:ribosome biogenesis factor YjgA n=1 Tax=Nitrosomonas sp. Nm51 TaxID=133720 RepID=UPI0008B794E7|nr:ribosome biogenesis factor YjgA [Nitrosomonas sp. Nm51]SEQ99095.1 ribosome-associated protein [Nitrosomonas sp. Nm51]
MQDTFDKTGNGVEKPSKTQRKQTMHALQKIGEQLTTLSDKQLDDLNLPDNLLEAIYHIRQIGKFGARQRQLQYIGKLIRQIDIFPIQDKLNAWQQKSLHQTALVHLTEHWRERILSDANALTEFVKQFPATEIQQIRLLVRKAHKEKNSDKPPKSYRLLFHALQTAIKNAQN